MKLTNKYVEIICNWWTQLLIDNKRLGLSKTIINSFKIQLTQFLEASDFEPGQLFKLRVNANTFIPSDSPLIFALSATIRAIGQTPAAFPHGAELIISENYEVYVRKSFAENLTCITLIDEPRTCSLNSLSDFIPVKLKASPNIENYLYDSSTEDDTEYSSDCSSFLTDYAVIPAASVKTALSPFYSSKNQNNLLKRNGLFNERFNTASVSLGKRQKFEEPNTVRYQNSI